MSSAISAACAPLSSLLIDLRVINLRPSHEFGYLPFQVSELRFGGAQNVVRRLRTTPETRLKRSSRPPETRGGAAPSHPRGSRAPRSVVRTSDRARRPAFSGPKSQAARVADTGRGRPSQSREFCGARRCPSTRARGTRTSTRKPRTLPKSTASGLPTKIFGACGAH